MSEKTITFRYHDEVKQVKVPNYKKCKNAFQREFSISDEKMKKLSLFYYDEEAEALVLNDNEDYRIFWESDFNEIEAKDNNEEEKLDRSIKSAAIFKKQNEEPIKDPLSKDNNEEEKPDPMRSATIFKKQNEEPIKDPLSKNESIVYSLNYTDFRKHYSSNMNRAQMMPLQNNCNQLNNAFVSMNLNNNQNFMNNSYQPINNNANSQQKNNMNNSLMNELNNYKNENKKLQEHIIKLQQEINRFK